jgi:hypothetical protein
MLQTATNCCKLLQTATRCYKVPKTAKNCYKVLQTAARCYKVPQSAAKCYKVQSATNCYKLLQGATNCRKVLQTATNYLITEPTTENCFGFPHEFSFEMFAWNSNIGLCGDIVEFFVVCYKTVNWPPLNVLQITTDAQRLLFLQTGNKRTVLLEMRNFLVEPYL